MIKRGGSFAARLSRCRGVLIGPSCGSNIMNAEREDGVSKRKQEFIVLYARFALFPRISFLQWLIESAYNRCCERRKGGI